MTSSSVYASLGEDRRGTATTLSLSGAASSAALFACGGGIGRADGMGGREACAIASCVPLVTGATLGRCALSRIELCQAAIATAAKAVTSVAATSSNARLRQ